MYTMTYILAEVNPIVRLRGFETLLVLLAISRKGCLADSKAL
jgi:hypothetical protein